MQSPTCTNSGPTTVTTALTDQPLDTGTEAQPALDEQHAREEGAASEAPVETDTVITPQENEAGVQTPETPATVADAQAVENETAVQPLSETSENPGGMEMDAALKTRAPPKCDSSTNPLCVGQKAKKQEKVVRDGRKYVPSKKAMIDPLKMDMSKPLVMPLTSSQLSLQCIECHIIFSDHKSKERHLKTSHPAEYEQCILRNALFACYVCDRHFTNSTELMVHQKAHIEKKPFKCQICSVAFKKSSELTIHKKIHFGQDGYACTDCGKPCKTFTLLKYHRRKHTGEKPYVCKECGKSFPMSKTLQRHMVSHLPEGAELAERAAAVKAQVKKKDGASTVKYSCPICKAVFKTTKTRQHHMKSKHNLLPAAPRNAPPAGQQLKLGTPIITPISICQPGLLQLESIGPLQKVDSNIDTEQIRRLIESLGNVQKVNQVVILGQVPSHVPPLEMQQISHLAEPVNVCPPQIDFIGQSESKTIELDTLNHQCDPMEQTIILEPITPDGQLENPHFSEFGSHMTIGESIELTFVQTEQTERPEGELMNQILQQPVISAIQSDPVNQMVCQDEFDDLKQNLEQTFILELTPALMPTVELEQSKTLPKEEIPSSSLVPTTELEKIPDQTVIDEQENGLSVPTFMSAVEMELTPLQTEQQDVTTCPFVQSHTLTETPSESKRNVKEHVESLVHTETLDLIHNVMDGGAPQEMREKAVQEPFEQESSEKLQVDHKTGQEQLSEVEDASAPKGVPSQLEPKQVPQISELPVNVMSAQELVKVRKRKPARAFIFQGYIQEQVRSIRKNDLQIEAKPAKRQRTKKSHLVVKFGPPSKEKKIKKQKKPSQQHQPTQEKEVTSNLSPKKAASQKKGRKGKIEREEEPLVSTAEIKSPSLNQEPQAQQIKEHTKQKKIKKQKEQPREVVMTVSEHKTAALPVFKKKKQTKIMRKDQPKKAKDGKKKKNRAKKEDVNTNTGTASEEIQDPHTTQDPLVLLKGHKQPQLKVYKLDPSKASSQTQEASAHDSQTMSHQSEDNNHPTSENNLTAETKKKGGRPKKKQKALSLLSSLQVSRQPPETLPTKPKTTRKRKASSKVETEGVITSSHSKRALECKDCGERFSELSSLQKHKATVHIVESPSLTYTHGNIFEGVSRLDLYQLPKPSDKVVDVMNAAAGWDTEPEMTELALEDRELGVCFPALIPSPSLPVPPSDVEMSAYGDKHGSKTGEDVQFHTSRDGCSSSDQVKNSEKPRNFPSESGLSSSTPTKNFETGEPSASDEAEQEKGLLKHPTPAPEVQAHVDEDVKEDLLLEVDLVTVGEQNEKDESDPASSQESVAQDESKGNSESGSTETPTAPGQAAETIMEKSLTWQTVSCSTHQVEIKEEEEEILVQRKKVEGKGAAKKNATRGRRRGRGHLKRGMIAKTFLGGDTIRGAESEKEQDECQVVYEKHAITTDSETQDEVETGTKTSQPGTNPECEAEKATAPAACLPNVPPAIEESPEEQVVFELESVTTSVEEVMNEGEERDRDVDQSPGIILEKFLTSRQRETADKEPCLRRSNQRQGLKNITTNAFQVPGSQEIKVEENISDPLLVAPSSQNRLRLNVQQHPQRDIRTVLVKEESSLVLNEAQASQGSRHIRWNVEPVENENTATPLNQTGETTNDSCITPEFNTNQCIFYPVKEEERELLLGASQTSRGSLTPGGSSVAHQTELQSDDPALYEGSHAIQDYQEIGVRGVMSETGVSDFTHGQAEADAEWPHPPDVRDFLLRSSDEEEQAELSEPQLESEAEVMAYFNKNKTIGAQQSDQTSLCLSTSTNQLLAPRDENRNRKPLDYFSKYFGWDTWKEIANCTNTLSSMSNPVTAREVAQFVGIHVAMGTLKFPSPRLYWEDLTKVPLVADAMPLSRFLELTCRLKFASPAKDPVNSIIQEERHDVDFQNGQQGKTLPSSQCIISQQSDGESQRDKTNDLNTSKPQTDPMWKVQPLLSRFKAGCQSLRREGDYAVDQYLLPLTGKLHNYKVSLYCTTLIGFGGLLLHLDFKLNLSDKEDAVEKMVPKGSMVFLCKQELSTPAMLERLLVAGVHGAGRVGGARGQIGDEFVSSDGKLMLRRSHCGFILSTAGNGQRGMASLTDNFEKAQMSALLNRDLRNLYPIPLTALAPTCWPQAVLWYLTDLALVNSWLLYRQDHKAPSAPLTLMAFRLEVSKALILSSGSDTQDSVPPQPPVEKTHSTSQTPNPTTVEECPLPDAATRYDGSGHWPEQLGEGEGGRCRFGDCQRTSRVLCLKCCVFLCISRHHNCFLNFHNQGSFGKE